MRLLISSLLTIQLAFLTLGLTSCGEDSNLNGIFFTTDDKGNAINDLVDEAEREYSLGHFSKAKSLISKVLARSPDNQEAIVLSAYIELSIAGVDSFQLASSLIDQNETKTATTALAASTSNCDSAQGAVKSLCELGSIIGLSDADYKSMETQDELPKLAEDARQAGVSVIEAVNRTITMICPFVHDQAKILVSVDQGRTNDDPRHIEAACPPFGGEVYYSAKAHYLWSFAHIVEGIAFYAVFSSKLTPLQAKVESLDATNTSAFLKDFVIVSNAIDQLLPTDKATSDKTMLTAIYNDLEAAGKGFGEIEGIPADITSSITDALAGLKAETEAIQAKQGGSTTDTDNSAAALKTQFTSEMTTEVQKKLSNADGSLTTLGTEITQDPEKQAEFCTAYGTLTTATLEGICS